jgi:acyl-CoA thioester hydrolase
LSAQPHTFQWPIRVYWEDTDAGGIVFYANYLKFFERARTEWLRHLGVQQHALKQETGGMFVVVHTDMRYLLPARLDDVLCVTARIREMGGSRLVLEQQAFSEGKQLLCEGQISIAWVNSATMSPTRMPATLRQVLLASLDTDEPT